MTPEEQACWDKLAAENAALRKDAERLNWLDANPRIIVRSGKQHIRPMIDEAIKRGVDRGPGDHQ